MSRNSRSRKTKKGRKRSLAAANLEQVQDTNPRASKRRRVSKEYESSINALLTMNDDEISRLPAALRKQAIALRQAQSGKSAPNKRNKSNNSDRRNNIRSDSSPSSQSDESDLDPLGSGSGSHSKRSNDSNDSDTNSDTESDDDTDLEEEESDSPMPGPRRRNPPPPPPPRRRQKVVPKQRVPQQLQQPPGALMQTLRPMTDPLIHQIYPSQPSLPVRTQIVPEAHRLPANSPYTPLHYNQPQSVNGPAVPLQPQQIRPFHMDPPSRLPTFRSNAFNQLLDDDDDHSDDVEAVTLIPGWHCRCTIGSVWFVIGCILLIPMLMAVMRSNSHGTNFCDTNARVTDHCIECPENAHFCIGGRAWCEDRSYWVDPTLNRCVKRSYIVDIVNNYKVIGQVLFDLGWKGGVYLWTQMKSSWLKGIDEHSFEAICQLFEVEIMIGFMLYLVVLRCIPSLRLIGILIWSRLLYPILGEEDLIMKLGLNMLSVIVLNLIVRRTWCNVTGLFGSA